MDFEILRDLLRPADTKIILLVMDGLGGLPREPGGFTELETANTPNLDTLARGGICGLHVPIANGITPGSGPAHLGIFGYNPIKYQVGRGVLSALGIDFPLSPEDVAARGNYCTIDEQGIVTDRRAGRISTEKNRELSEKLRQIDLPGVEVFVETVKEHRFLFVIRSQGLSGEVSETDPNVAGLPPRTAEAEAPQAEKTAELVRKFANQARQVLEDQQPANMVLLRGFSKQPDWPRFGDVFGLKGVAIAGYPMYRGVAKLVGMEALPSPPDVPAEFELLRKSWNDYDFFFIHVKSTDSAGEDGDFDRKVSVIEEVDQLLPRIMDMNPDVLIVTGDHSTPAVQAAHSWHPVPVLLWSPFCRADSVDQFGERACNAGALGPRFPAEDLMALALANAGRLDKFGA